MSNQKVNIIVLIFTFISIVALLALYICIPKLKLDKKYVEVNVFDEYQKIAYKATYLGKDITNEVGVGGYVDTEHIGKYKITYKIKKGIFNVVKQATVNVVDKEEPKLELIGDEEFKVCSIKHFIEPGYKAIDNYDGDITNNVEKKHISDNEIEYIATDSSFNASKKTRKLVEIDDEAPVIKLLGNQTIYLTVGASYTEPGYEASDNCDNDLKEQVKTEGSVDTSKAGTYTIKYSVKDTANNETSVERKVIVSENKATPEVRVNNTSGVIYLTFDDGPSNYTSQILDTLAKYNIKATFFVTKNGSDDLIKREYNEGHTMALHTYTHDWNIYKSVDTYLDDLNKIANRVKTLTGVDSKYVRFPGGSSNQKIYHRSNNTITIYDLINALNERGYKYFDWNVSVEDAGGCASVSDKQSCVINNFKKYLKPNKENIVLMHDIKGYTAAGLETMIQYGLANNYTFKAIDDSTEPVHFR